MSVEHRVSFPNKRGQKLIGIVHNAAAREPNAAVILCHGMESSKESEKLVRRLTAQGAYFSD